MPESSEPDELIVRLTKTTRLSRHEVVHLLDEVWAYLAESSEEFLRRRHAEMQREGIANPQIFVRLVEELESRPFRAPRLSVRQIRRSIYG